jgi:hypothetical protein
MQSYFMNANAKKVLLKLCETQLGKLLIRFKSWLFTRLTSLRNRSAFAGLGWLLFLVYLLSDLHGQKYPRQENQ